MLLDLLTFFTIGKDEVRGQVPQPLRLAVHDVVPVMVQLPVGRRAGRQVDSESRLHDQAEIGRLVYQLEVAVHACTQKLRGKAGQEGKPQIGMALPQCVQHRGRLRTMTEAVRCDRRQQMHRLRSPYTRPAACWSAW